LFEAFIIRGLFDEYRKVLDKYKITMAEVSDGSLTMNHDVKCNYIHQLAKDYTVLSEVGSKEEGIIIHPSKWTTMMKKELEAGSWKVIAEARESGNVGIYHRDGKTHTLLIDKIIAKINPEKIMWEAPIKSQQVWFIKSFGANVNLGNIAPNDIIPLETLRIGLRGDTFFSFLPKEMNKTIEKL
jgi:phosphosulfolactate synthase